MPYLSLDHLISFRLSRRKEQFTFLMHSETPFQDLGGYFSLPIRGHYCTPADTASEECQEIRAVRSVILSMTMAYLLCQVANFSVHYFTKFRSADYQVRKRPSSRFTPETVIFATGEAGQA